MKALFRHHHMLALIMLVLIGCSPVESQVNSIEPVIQDATETTQPASTPGPQKPDLIGPADRYYPTAEFVDNPRTPPTPNLQKVEIPLVTMTPDVSVCSPLAGLTLEELPGIISSPYDPPPAGKEDRHHGVDFSFYRRGEQASIQGTGVQAVLSGVAAMALADSFPYGNVVIVESTPADIPVSLQEGLGIGVDESIYILYAHMERTTAVKTGQAVAACQQLGTVGKSGNAGVAHLHLETRLGQAGIIFDRMGYYQATSTDQEKENYLRWRISGDFRHFDPMIVLSSQISP